MNSHSNIIKGNDFASAILLKLAAQIKFIKEKKDLVPTLAIVLVGEDPASIIYIRNKMKAAEGVGIRVIKIMLPSTISTADLLIKINELNTNDKVSGIIVQLPLPEHMDKNLVLSSIDEHKDVDGFNPINVGLLNIGSKNGFVPGTALGVLTLIKEYEPNLNGKNIVIIGRSNIVGKPLAALLLNENSTVTICHSKTENLSSITSKANIVVSAIGKPNFLDKSFFNANSIVIDVGITKNLLTGKLAGDVSFEEVHGFVRYITPVPGGVGPMTIAYLLSNTFKAFVKNQNLTEFADEKEIN